MSLYPETDFQGYDPACREYQTFWQMVLLNDQLWSLQRICFELFV